MIRWFEPFRVYRATNIRLKPWFFMKETQYNLRNIHWLQVFRQGPDPKLSKLNLVSKWRVPQAPKGSGKGGNRDRHQDFEGRNPQGSSLEWQLVTKFWKIFFCESHRSKHCFPGDKMITFQVILYCSYFFLPQKLVKWRWNVVSGCNLRADMASLPYCCAEGPPDYADAASAASERSQRQQNRQRFLSGNSGGLVFEMCICASWNGIAVLREHKPFSLFLISLHHSMKCIEVP